METNNSELPEHLQSYENYRLWIESNPRSLKNSYPRDKTERQRFKEYKTQLIWDVAVTFTPEKLPLLGLFDSRDIKGVKDAVGHD